MTHVQKTILPQMTRGLADGEASVGFPTTSATSITVGLLMHFSRMPISESEKFKVYIHIKQSHNIDNAHNQSK
jgi:hypothetical protein